MEQPADLTNKVSFGQFEADLQTGELRKRGIKVKLQEQPFRVLAILLEHSGGIVDREELQKRVWGSDTFVDFDHSLATAINKIREALGDSSDNPRFVETIARRGYRFIAPVQEGGPNPTSADGSRLATQELRVRASRRRWRIIGVVAGAFVLGGLTSVFLQPRSPELNIAHYTRITHSGTVYPGELPLEDFPTYVTDGTRIYFPEMNGGSGAVANASVAGGDTRLLATPSEIVGPSVADISPDGSKLLIRNHLAPELDQPLWIVPVLGGEARRVGNVLAHDATWWPDGQSILYASGNELIRSKPDGTDSRKFLEVPGRAFWMRWSPDGKQLAFTLVGTRTHTRSLWEVSSAGTHLHPIFSARNGASEECCGNWTPDGKYFVFQASRDGKTSIWAIREKVHWFSDSRKNPVRVTAGPLNFLAPVPSRNGKELFMIGEQRRTETLSFNASSHHFVPYLSELGPISCVDFSRDGKWVAYVSAANGSLWRSKLDGSERLQLTSPPLRTYMMRWSPDGSRIAFMGKMPGEPWKLYGVPADGGTPQPLVMEKRDEADPGWSPDGSRLVFGRPPAYMAEDSSPKSIYILNTKTGKVSTLPGSQGLFSPRWSPAGKYLAAISVDQRRLMLFDFATRQWRMLARGSVDNPVWSPDSEFIYFHAFMDSGQPIYRIRISDDQLDMIANFKDLRRDGAINYAFLGLNPGGYPIVSIRLSSADIYALNWQGVR